MHRARQGAGADRAQTGTGGSRLRLRVPAAGAGLLVLGMRRGDPTTTPAAAARRGAAHKASPVSTAPGKRDRGSSFEAFRGLVRGPVNANGQRSPPNSHRPTPHPPPGCPRGGVSQGDEESKSVPVGRPARAAGPGCVSVRPFAFPRQLPGARTDRRSRARTGRGVGRPRTARNAAPRNPV